MYQGGLKELRELIVERENNNKDTVIALTGDEGEGKSLSGVFGIAKKIYPDFSLRDNVVYTGCPDEFNDKYDKLVSSGGVIQIDEAIKLLYKMDFMLGAVKELVKDYGAKIRKEKKAAHILCIPSLDDLHKNFRNHRVKVWIELLPREDLDESNRVSAVIMVKQRNAFGTSADDTWLLKEFSKLWYNKYKRGNFGYDAKIDLMRSHPFYFGETFFKRPSDHDEAMYLIERQNALNKYEPKDNVADNRSKNQIRLEAVRDILILQRKKEGRTDDEIAKEIGYSRQHTNELIRKAEKAINMKIADANKVISILE